MIAPIIFLRRLPSALFVLVASACGGTMNPPTDAEPDAGSDGALQDAPSDAGPMDSAVDVSTDAAQDSSGPFSVKDVQGLVLWLDGTTGITQNAMRVSAWADQSGNGNHAVQASATMQPSYVPSGIGGRPCVHFDSFAMVGQILSVPDAATLQLGTKDFALEIVARYGNDPTSAPELTRAAGAFVVKMVFANPGPGVAFFGNTPGNKPYTSAIQGITESATQATSVGTGYNDGMGRVLGFRRANTTLEVRAANTVVGTATYNFVTDVSAVGVPLSIGATGGQGYPEASMWRLDGDICEVILVKGALSGSDLVQIESYLKAKYSL